LRKLNSTSEPSVSGSADVGWFHRTQSIAQATLRGGSLRV
jgi:hypothetical protein